MSLENPLKPQVAMQDTATGEHFYPMTCANQVLMENGNRLDTYLSGMVIPNGMELLWENPDPTAEFPAQTISLDLSKYTTVLVRFLYATTLTMGKTFICFVGQHYTEEFITSKDLAQRNFTINTTGIVFEDTKATGLNDTDGWFSNTYNFLCIPVAIYGIKDNASIGGEGTLLNADMLGNVAASEYVQKSEVGIDLLWENANPTSAFVAQTISLDLSNYSRVLIYTEGLLAHPDLLIGKRNLLRDGSDKLGFRYININSQSIVFENGIVQGVGADNTCLVPNYIYGIK